MEMRILGSGREVGRAAIYLKTGETGVLLDYGVNFDEHDTPQLPLHVRPADVSFIVISHAHLDHVGAAPYMFITGNLKVYATKPTMDIARLLVLDFLKLNSYYVEYEIREFDRMYRSTEFLNYGERAEYEGFTVQLFNAGHILGSSMTYLETPDGHKILYTGDMNTIRTWTLSEAEQPPYDVGTLVIEATYGGRNHPPRHLAERKLHEVVEETIDREGTVLIPAFSVGRTQEVIAMLHAQAPYLDIYIDGMSREVTEIYLKYKKFLRDPALFQRVFENVNFVTDSSVRRKLAKKQPPCVIVASAGMLKGGPSLYYLKHLAGNAKNSIVLVSYQATNSNGHKLLETGMLPDQGIDYPVKARIEWIDLSSHAGSDDLLRFISKYKSSLKNLILVHGSPEDVNTLAGKVQAELGKDLRVFTPSNGETVKLEF